MARIPTEIVAGTWQQMAAGDDDDAEAVGRRFAEEQPELVEYVFGVSETLGHGAAELAVYLATVIWSMFERSHAVVPRVRSDTIEDAHARNIQLLEDLEELDEDDLDEGGFIREIHRRDAIRQPAVLGYLYESLVEAEQSAAELERHPEDVGTLFVVLKSVVDTLDSALGFQPRAEA